MGKMRSFFLSALLTIVAGMATAEIQIVDGVKYECKDGLCTMIGPADDVTDAVDTNKECKATVSRMTQGYLSAQEFARWLEGKDKLEDILVTSSFGGLSFWLGLLLVLLGGLAMNLTPCVLPMVPINLMVIGKSVMRGVWYGLGLALAYGALGVAAAIGGLAFGTIQGSPWFNLCVALIFLVLSLALSGFFFIDFSKRRATLAQKKTSFAPGAFAFFMGVTSAVLAGACVAPILISVLLLTAKLYGEGNLSALGLPFVLGLGMALPWPFLGAGLRVLPKPGAWMKLVNRLFALLVLGFAIWYGRLAWKGFAAGDRPDVSGEMVSATPKTFPSVLAAMRLETSKPILVDCWATWCKNCAAMEREMDEPAVRKALESYSVIRLQAEDMVALRKLDGFASVRGLPAFVIFGGK